MRCRGRWLPGAAVAGALCLAGMWTAVAWGETSEVARSEVRRSGAGTVEERAADWGVGERDVRRYRQLMEGRRGIWSPGADPLLVLGAHARTVEERRRLAEAYVRSEHARVEGELAFEREVQAAWRRLYGDEPRVGGGALARMESPPSRFAVAVRRSCAQCGALVRRFMGRGAPVDLYVEGAVGDEDLRAWVAEQGLDAGVIASGRVTVNHGDGGVAVLPSAWARMGDAWERVE